MECISRSTSIQTDLYTGLIVVGTNALARLFYLNSSFVHHVQVHSVHTGLAVLIGVIERTGKATCSIGLCCVLYSR